MYALWQSGLHCPLPQRMCLSSRLCGGLPSGSQLTQLVLGRVGGHLGQLAAADVGSSPEWEVFCLSGFLILCSSPTQDSQNDASISPRTPSISHLHLKMERGRIPHNHSSKTRFLLGVSLSESPVLPSQLLCLMVTELDAWTKLFALTTNSVPSPRLCLGTDPPESSAIKTF